VDREETYRTAARRRFDDAAHDDVVVPSYGTVQETADRSGAYVEALVWVPAPEEER